MPTDDSNWVLVGKNNTEYVLPPSMIFLGREECDVILVSQSVDKRHAVITYDHYLHRFKVKDLNSLNGTYVNNVRISEQTYVKLNHMDTLRFGYDTCVYHIREPFKDIKSQEPDVVKLSEPSPPSMKSPSISPALSNTSSCQGCIQEMLVSRQMSPAISSPTSSPILDEPLHISEESLANVNIVNGSTTTRSVNSNAAKTVNDVNKIPIECVHNSSVPHAIDSKLSSPVSDVKSEPINKDDATSMPVSSSQSVMLEVSTPLSSPTAPVVTTCIPSQMPASTVVRSVAMTCTNLPHSTESPINYSPVISSEFLPHGLPAIAPLHPVLQNPSHLMSASYPSPGFSALANQHHVAPLIHPATSEAYHSRFANPMNCYQQGGFYQNHNQPNHNIDASILQSSPDLTAYGSLYHQSMQQAPNNNTWSGPDAANIGVGVIPSQSIISNISGDSLELHAAGLQQTDPSSISSENTATTSLESSTPITKSSGSKDMLDGQVTPLYGQPAWWGENDTLNSANNMQLSKDADNNKQSSTMSSSATPVATAFTIDFDVPKTSAPNKKLAIKDKISKYAPPKSEEVRGHRRSSSQNIVVEDDIVQKEDKKSIKSTPPKGNSKLHININKTSRAHHNNVSNDQNNRTKPDIVKKCDASSKGTVLVNKLDLVPYQSSGITPMKETTAYLLEKMLNSDSDKPSVQHRIKGSPEDRIRRKTVILSPKEEFVDEKRNVLLSPSEEVNEIPDDISEAGTYTLDVDKPNPEAEAARNKIDEAFGLLNGNKVSPTTQPLLEGNCDSYERKVQKPDNSRPPIAPPVAPPRIRHKGDKSAGSISTTPAAGEAPRHRRKLPTPPVDQSPLNLKSTFNPKLDQNGTMNINPIRNGDISYDTKKILKDTENVVTAMQARIKSNTLGYSSPVLMHMGGSSSSDSELDVSSASLASDSALLNRRKKFTNASNRKHYTSDDGRGKQTCTTPKQTYTNRPFSAGVQSFKLERPSSVQSNSSESSDSSRKKKSPADLSLKVNRAFELRKARAEDDHTPVKAPSKSRPGSAGSTRGTQSITSSARLAPNNNFNRSDGGRFSLRVKSAPPSKPKGPTKKELEMAAWTRRKAYNPMKAAAQSKKTTQKMDESFYTDDEIPSPLPSNQSDARDSSPTNRQGSQRLEALDILVISSIHQLSSKLRLKSQEVLSVARDNSYEEKERKKLDDAIGQMNLVESPPGNNTKELSSILKNLKRIEIGLEVLKQSSCLRQVPNKDEEYY